MYYWVIAGSNKLVYVLYVSVTVLYNYFRGVLKIAEVASRFENVRSFITALANLGFKLESKVRMCTRHVTCQCASSQELRINFLFVNLNHDYSWWLLEAVVSGWFEVSSGVVYCEYNSIPLTLYIKQIQVDIFDLYPPSMLLSSFSCFFLSLGMGVCDRSVCFISKQAHFFLMSLISNMERICMMTCTLSPHQ